MLRIVVILASVAVAFAANKAASGYIDDIVVPLDNKLVRDQSDDKNEDVMDFSPVDNKIVDGQAAAPGQFPYQIVMRLASNGFRHCGGTIIAPRFIVTAAHCVYQRHVGEFFIVAGTNSFSSGGQAYTLASMSYHREYDTSNNHNDIALLKTSTDIVYSALVQPLPIQTGEIPAGAKVTLSGWGMTFFPGDTVGPDNLQYAHLIAIDINKCAQELAPNPIFHSQICTLTRLGQGACHGDSGGPLVYQGTLVGVVSWGRPCGLGYPDVYSKASMYVGWIQSTMESM